jgi:hypothetical protein
MSLVGSLEDLSLGDILQIISLSEKSGVLSLQTIGCDGRIVFIDGLVCGAQLNGGPGSMRGLLVEGGYLAEAEFEAASAYAAETGESLAASVAAVSDLSAARVESLCREATEAAVVEMFAWATGNFNFDVRQSPEIDDLEILPEGINSQYLAMKATGRGDEGSEGELSSQQAAEPAADASGLDGAGFDDCDAVSAHEQSGVAQDGDPPAEQPVTVAATSSGDESQRVAENCASVAPNPTAPPSPCVMAGALVVLDDDLLSLEWAKSVLRSEFSPIHIFQNMDQALSRIRQYLVRGKPPVLLVSPDAKVDSMGGIRDTTDFVARLKAQSPDMKILWLQEEAVGPAECKGAADGLVLRPAQSQLRPGGDDEQSEVLARDFVQRLQLALSSSAAGPPAVSAEPHKEIPRESLGQLRDATRELTAASSRGEILPVTIRFAADSFERVAMFLVHEGKAVGIAQHGLSLAGGPDDADLRNISFDVADSGWLSRVLTASKPVIAAAQTDGDRALASLLGDEIPEEAYLAPIESSGQVIAVLYCDNLPGRAAIGDTSALEVVLHHAGLALDRAALERALREQGSSA